MTVTFSALAPAVVGPFTALPGVAVTQFASDPPVVLTAGGLVESPLYPGLWS